MNILVNKICRVCKESKPLTEFGVNRHIKCGVNSICKVCNAEASAEYKKTHPEANYRANHSPAGKAKLARYRARHRAEITAKRKLAYAKNRTRILAAAKVNAAMKAQQREYREANKEREKARVAEWQKENRDKCAARTARYRRANPDAVRTSYLKAKAARPWEAATKSAARRAAKLRAMPVWANRFFIAEAYRLAKLRTKATGIKWEVDHFYPLVSPVVCGLHVENNLRVIPEMANRAKGNRVPHG